MFGSPASKKFSRPCYAKLAYLSQIAGVLLSMTHADLESKAKRQLRSLAVWLRRANATIDSKVSDAAAHMMLAVTETLKRLPDGRQTLRKATRSSSTQAAVSRMGELLDILAGGSSRSLDGLVRDAREAFYREAFAEWREIVPPDLFVSAEPEPTQANIARVRGMVIHGSDLRQEVAGAVVRASDNIPRAVTLAGRRNVSGRVSTEFVSTWRRKSSNAIKLNVRLALSDSQVAADVLAGRDLIHADYLDDIPIAVGG